MPKDKSEILSLLAKKGWIDIIYELKNGPRSFNELKVLYLSPNTVLIRLREAQEASLVEEVLIRDKGGRSKIKYQLTEKGANLIWQNESIVKQYLNIREKMAKLEERKKNYEREIQALLSTIQKTIDLHEY